MGWKSIHETLSTKLIINCKYNNLGKGIAMFRILSQIANKVGIRSRCTLGGRLAKCETYAASSSLYHRYKARFEVWGACKVFM